ncbi:putative quinol monooxygenase [Brenneria populi subsp. brevivirga]|uniref:Quinol monooxygenase n=1 Tax=Brenneria populi TaxID=1505588 RepID=A0ABU6JKB4_9GAMM|nr:putative quinol monooxygenase [Brenneria populi subsp. brevivirga]MEC5341127.1 putative quinol monooxygenase [Brenneria populi Li et al. 2015]
MEIRIVAILRAKAEFIDEVTAAVKAAVAPSRQEAGNLQYDLHEEIDKPGAFVFFERWKNQAALTEHEQSSHFQRLISSLEGKTDESTIKLMKFLG